MFEILLFLSILGNVSSLEQQVFDISIILRVQNLPIQFEAKPYAWHQERKSPAPCKNCEVCPIYREKHDFFGKRKLLSRCNNEANGLPIFKPELSYEK